MLETTTDVRKDHPARICTFAFFTHRPKHCDGRLEACHLLESPIEGLRAHKSNESHLGFSSRLSQCRLLHCAARTRVTRALISQTNLRDSSFLCEMALIEKKEIRVSTYSRSAAPRMAIPVSSSLRRSSTTTYSTKSSSSHVSLDLPPYQRKQ